MSTELIDAPAALSFRDLGLRESLLETLEQLGYETPSPIQEKTIPHLIAGEDMVGQAQTGTGKTAAFALPVLNNIDMGQKTPQVLVLTPTRELAIQVAESFERYASGIDHFRVAAIYGGQEYRSQLQQLKRGVQVVVGTPGRVMDHLRRGTLDLSELQTLVLDEADEMLRMGFIDDVEWIMDQTPDDRQIALFSATMPPAIRKIAQKYLDEPTEITIKRKTETATTINQRYWMLNQRYKFEALTRILEAEEVDGMIIFVQTKSITVTLAEKLEARGFKATALNGDIPQHLRERTVDRLKEGKIDIVIATDVAARGLDVQRISHVINYDIPREAETYVHRVGRTGRAGRKGEAIALVTPRDSRLLHNIERMTKQSLAKMEPISAAQINESRVKQFKGRITETLEQEDLGFYQDLIEEYQKENPETSELQIAAALSRLIQGKRPLLLNEDEELDWSGRRNGEKYGRDRAGRDPKGSGKKGGRQEHHDENMESFKIQVGHSHGVKPGNIVGAVANESGLDSKYIGRIQIYDQYSTIDLPRDLPQEMIVALKKVRVAGQQLKITKFEGGSAPEGYSGRKPFGKSFSKGKPGKKNRFKGKSKRKGQ